MYNIVEKWQRNTSRIEPWWTLVGAPIIQEFIFRFVPYQIYLSYGEFYVIGVASALLFAVIHWYFGKWFVLYSLVWGLILWVIIVNYGFLWTVIVHSAINILHWKLGILPRKSRTKYT